jgi:hypothetical protein
LHAQHFWHRIALSSSVVHCIREHKNISCFLHLSFVEIALFVAKSLSLSLSRTRVHALAFSPSPTRAFFSRVTHKHSHSRAHTQISLMHLDIRDENRESIITQSNILFKVHLKPS